MTFKRLSIAIDLDSTVCDHLGEWLRMYNEDFGAFLQVSDLKSWDMAQNVPIGQEVYAYLNDPHLYRRLVPYPGAVEVIRRLVERGHEVDIVTTPSSHESTAADKIWWCRQYLPFIPGHNINLMHKKHKFACDVFIDDAPKHIQQFAVIQPNTKRIAIAFPFNECVKDLLHLRAESFENPAKAWAQIEVYIDELAKTQRD